MKYQTLILIFLLAITVLSLPLYAFAQETKPLWEFIKGELRPIEDVYGRPVDPREVVANVIKVLLSLLGILYICFIIYGGYLWMTAGGNDERVMKAKSAIRNGAIGIAIILSAFAIARFVVITFGCAVSIEGGFCLFFNGLTSF